MPAADERRSVLDISNWLSSGKALAQWLYSAAAAECAKLLERMSADGPQQKDGDGDAFDVVLMHGPTDDGEGARVLRARPGRIDAGEVRPMRDGRPLVAGGEVVHLERRANAPALYDVRVECVIPGSPVARQTGSAPGGPPQVATRAYRESWELTFGTRRHALN